MLGAERPEATRRAGRGRHGRLGAGRVYLRDPGGDQILADRLAVDLAEQLLDVAVIGGGETLEHRIGVVVTSLDTLEVEDREATEASQRAGHPGVDHRVHRGGQDRDRQVDAAQGLGEIDVRRLDGVGARSERHVLETVGRADRIHLRMEDAALRRTRRLGWGGDPGSIDHVLLLCRQTLDSARPRAPRVYQRVSFGCPR